MVNQLLSILVLSHIILSAFSLIIINNESFIVVQWSEGTFSNNQTEILIPNDQSNLTGRVAWLVAPNSNNAAFVKPFVKAIEDFAKRGCIGVIVATKNRLPGAFIYSSEATFSIPVGVVEYKIEDYIHKLGDIANFTFIDWDPNPWDISHTGVNYIIICALLVLLFLINTGYAGYRCVKWVYTLGERFEVNIGISCLLLEFICNLLRTLQMILMPLHNNFRLPSVDVLYTLPVCLTLITSILIVLFWLDLTTDPFYHGKFLGVMKIPAIVFVIILLVLEIILDGVRSTTSLDIMGISVGCYIAIHCIVVIFNIVAGFRLLRSLSKQEDGKKKLSFILRRIIYSGFVTLLGIVFYILLLTKIMYYPLPSTIITFILFFTNFLQSLLLIMIFKIPKHKSTTQTSASSSVKEESTTQ